MFVCCESETILFALFFQHNSQSVSNSGLSNAENVFAFHLQSWSDRFSIALIMQLGATFRKSQTLISNTIVVLPFLFPYHLKQHPSCDLKSYTMLIQQNNLQESFGRFSKHSLLNYKLPKVYISKKHSCLRYFSLFIHITV